MLQKAIALGRGGSITLLAKLRQAFGIQEKDPLIADLKPEGILWRPLFSVPIEFDFENLIGEFASKEADLRKRFSYNDGNQAWLMHS